MWYFPLKKYSGVPVQDHPGAFGVQRKYEIHTGVDLYTEDGEAVHAMETGIVVGIEPFTGAHDKSPWWNDTFCILIEGPSGVVCYGEVANICNLQIDQSVIRGEIIANVKRVLKDGKERPDIPGHSLSMLHLEKYPHGTKKASDGWCNYLQDPTSNLLGSENFNGTIFTANKWFKRKINEINKLGQM